MASGLKKDESALSLESEVDGSPSSWKEKFYSLSENEMACRDQLGMKYLKDWKYSSKHYCKPSGSHIIDAKSDSVFQCRTVYHNRKLNSWCEGKNLYIDPYKLLKQPKFDFHEFYRFNESAIGVKNCKRDAELYSKIDANLFLHNTRDVPLSLSELDESEQPKCSKWIDHPVYFAKRYLDPSPSPPPLPPSILPRAAMGKCSKFFSLAL